MYWDPTLTMTKEKIREYYTREIAQLTKTIEGLRDENNDNFSKVCDLETEIERILGQDDPDRVALSNLLLMIDEKIHTADMDEWEFETVREARRLAHETDRGNENLKPWDKGILEGLV